jgi:hypothetical protein
LRIIHMVVKFRHKTVSHHLYDMGANGFRAAVLCILSLGVSSYCRSYNP